MRIPAQKSYVLANKRNDVGNSVRPRFWDEVETHIRDIKAKDDQHQYSRTIARRLGKPQREVEETLADIVIAQGIALRLLSMNTDPKTVRTAWSQALEAVLEAA